jgi:hypothetical protein
MLSLAEIDSVTIVFANLKINSTSSFLFNDPPRTACPYFRLDWINCNSIIALGTLYKSKSWDEWTYSIK